MKISVIGPGALGCMFAARLSNSGATTTLIDHDSSLAAFPTPRTRVVWQLLKSLERS